MEREVLRWRLLSRGGYQDIREGVLRKESGTIKRERQKAGAEVQPGAEVVLRSIRKYMRERQKACLSCCCCFLGGYSTSVPKVLAK